MSLPSRYSILRSLGRGSQGEVFLAVDRFRGDSLVAVKCLHAEVDSAGGALAREFLTLSRFQHPGIARVRDFGVTTGQTAFFTSDYVSGGNILDWTADREPAVRWPWLIQAAGQALSALSYLTRHGVSHGDIKPANLLVEIAGSERERDSTLKLIDFGMARHRAARRGAAAQNGAPGEPGRRAGTPAYLPSADLQNDGSAWADARIDLYALGMSLFHAAAGRLPFRLGEDSALEEWRRRKEPARLRELQPDAPPVLDALISGLTSIHRGAAFETAAEALEFLKEKVSLRSASRRELGAHTCLDARREVIEALARAGVARGTRRPQLILGPAGSGKRMVLMALVSHLQVRGFRVILFRDVDDADAYRELQAMAEDVSGTPLTCRRNVDEEAVDILVRLRSGRLAILLSFDEERRDREDHAESAAVGAGMSGGADTRRASPPRTFFRALVRNLESARGSRSSGSLPFFCVATHAPERLRDELSAPLHRFDRTHLRPLSSASIREVSRDYFMVDNVPESLIERLARESSGYPAALLEALVCLDSVGVRADSLGHLKLPRQLPERLVTARRGRSGIRRLQPRTRRALGLLVVAREALSAEELSERFPSERPEEWRRHLETLHLQGFCGLVDGGDLPRFQARVDRESLASRRLLSREEESVARVELSRFFTRGPAASLGGRLAAVWNELARARVTEALSIATPLASVLLRRQREADLADLVEAFSTTCRLEQRTDPRSMALRLRGARAFLRRGRYGAAIRVIGERTTCAPTWFRRQAQTLKAEILDAEGRHAEAIDELSWLLELESAVDLGRDPTGASAVCRLELHARLAPLYFQTGDKERGRTSLEKARGAFDLVESLSRGMRDLVEARILSLFVGPLAVHGDPAMSARFLERTLRLPRRGRRDGLVRTALNELGILYVRSRRWRDALGVFREAETLALRSGDRLSAMRAAYNQAVTHYRLDDLSRAESLFHRARAVSDDLGVHAFAPTIWLGFGGVLRERGRLLEAARLYRRVLRAGADVRPNDRALAHNNLAEIYLQLGRLRRSLQHSSEAVRGARGIDNRFLLALTTCLHGVVHWALGRPEEARSLIEDATSAARAHGDPRPAGVCELSLGRVETSRGELRAAVGHLRRAIAASRAADDRAHLSLSRLELSAILLSRGKTRTAARWLPDMTRRVNESGFFRGRLAASILALKLSPDWPRGDSRLVPLYRDSLERGEVWETFVSLRRELLSGDLCAGVAQTLSLEHEALLARIARRVPPEFRASFGRFWALEDAETRDEARAESGTGSRRAPAESAAPPAMPAPGDEGSAPGTPGTRGLVEGLVATRGGNGLVPPLLERFRRFLHARSLSVFEVRGGNPRPLHIAAAGRGKRSTIRALAEERAESLARAAATDDPVAADPYLLLRLPGEDPRRIVCVELEPGAAARTTAPDVEAGAHAARDAAFLAACALDIEAGRIGLRLQSGALEETRAEIRRLNALMTTRASELETALMTRRREMREVQRLLETQGLQFSRPSRTPVGRSAAMRAILNRLPRIAAEKHAVLLVGESGVGKDLLARWIHAIGPRRDLPYVAEVCNLSETLVEAELFGFVKGAFTDALEDRHGLFERVAGGTLYLDEITEAAPRLQAKILRVLEEKRVRPVGGERSVPVDFRFLASSRQAARDLESGALVRKDLYYRLSGEVIEIPPLRDRPEDVPVLVDAILARLTSETGAQRPYIHPEVMETWSTYAWPGNVRELENELQRLLIENPHEITPESLATSRRAGRPDGQPLPIVEPRADSVPSLREARLRTERELVLRALDLHRGNASRAAKALQVTRRYLGSLMEKHGIELQSIKRAWARDSAGRGPRSAPGQPPSASRSLAASRGRRGQTGRRPDERI